MGDPATLHASHTHLFPGARLTAAGRRWPTGPVRVVFSDGAEAGGELLEPDALAVDAYRTAAGREIPAKRWRVEEGAVRARLP